MEGACECRSMRKIQGILGSTQIYCIHRERTVKVAFEAGDAACLGCKARAARDPPVVASTLKLYYHMSLRRGARHEGRRQ